jgi:hypothetical protein
MKRRYLVHPISLAAFQPGRKALAALVTDHPSPVTHHSSLLQPKFWLSLAINVRRNEIYAPNCKDQFRRNEQN